MGEAAEGGDMTQQGGAIFLLGDDRKLVPMRESPYDSEDLLQMLLVDYPDLLAGEQMNRSTPRRWVLIRREAGVPSRQGGPDQWSADHLFLDQDGVPTIIEVKRSSDTRIRREVVGQMLDYAANAVAYWPVERIRTLFEQMCSVAGTGPGEVLAELLGTPVGGLEDPETAFWQNVERNLQAGKLRMVFVADIIPPELQRIVEFLNGQMNPAEVFAVEIRQYVGSGARTLVPRVFGLTAEATTRKETLGPVQPWDKARFLEELTARRGPEASSVAAEVIEWYEANGWRVDWGRGRVYGTLLPYLPILVRGNVVPFIFWTTGPIQVQFGALRTAEPFGNETKRRELRERLNQIPGVALPEDVDKYPSFDIAALEPRDSRERYFLICDWIKRGLQAASNPAGNPAATD